MSCLQKVLSPIPLLLLCLTFVGAVSADTQTSPSAAPPAVDIEMFVREGCPHCVKAKEFLAALAMERPDVRISVRDINQDDGALAHLQRISEKNGILNPSVPAFYVNGRLIVGFSEEAHTDRLIRAELDRPRQPQKKAESTSDSCVAEEPLACGEEKNRPTQEPESFEIELLGHTIALDQAGLPMFTLAMGLLDGFNPCSMWVLILMISLLAPMGNRWRMFAVAGVFIGVEGLSYFVFMAAWLNLFLIIGLSRLSEILIAMMALLAGSIHIKDFLAYGRGPTLSIPNSAKPGIYARLRAILQADNLSGAILGTVVLAVLVQIVEFLCTSGFPALYTRILTLHRHSGLSYYGYLLLYNAAYMLDDAIVLGIGIITLSQRRLREKEGRWLKLISGAVMAGLALYLLMKPQD